MARQFVRSQKKAKLWLSTPSVDLFLSAAGTVAGGSIPFSSPQTVLRMLGEYIIAPNTAPTAADRCRIAVGVAKVSTDAFTLGATALPDPAGDPEFPWLYWMQHSFFYSDVSLESGGVRDVRVSYDIRSMRKFNSGESLAWVAQYVDVAGTPPMRLGFGQTRVLTTLH